MYGILPASTAVAQSSVDPLTSDDFSPSLQLPEQKESEQEHSPLMGGFWRPFSTVRTDSKSARAATAPVSQQPTSDESVAVALIRKSDRQPDLRQDVPHGTTGPVSPLVSPGSQRRIPADRRPPPIRVQPASFSSPPRSVTQEARPLIRIRHSQVPGPELPAEQIVVFPETVAPDSGPQSTLELPLTTGENRGEINFGRDGEQLTLSFRDAPVREILGVLAESQGLNIVCSGSAETRITGNFQSITFDDAMTTLLSVSGQTWTRRNNVIVVTPLNSETKLAPEAQGREVRVFTLNYLSAADVQKACTGLMSPSGTIVITESDPTNTHKTREQVLVEDLPMYLDRIGALILQMDVAPRQVLIEAHILQVNLADDLAHGVDFAKLGSIAGTDVLVASPGFNGKITDLSTFASPAYNVGIFSAGSFSGLVELLQKTTDAKTLASPKVLVLNGQVAHVQIGKRLGYHVTTTTQTSSLQSVQFLDTGVVLNVTPHITDDNQIMMTVKPEVSDGSVDSLGLPSSTTTEVETNIMLPDGKGMVIGGLIKESDTTHQQKIPVLGSMWGIGRLFRRNAVTRDRSEIIIVLVPHIVCGPHFDAYEDEVAVDRATTPLLTGQLGQYPRPWEPKLPDAVDNPRHVDKDRVAEFLEDPIHAEPHHLQYYFPPVESEQACQNMMFESLPLSYSAGYSRTNPGTQTMPEWAPAPMAGGTGNSAVSPALPRAPAPAQQPASRL